MSDYSVNQTRGFGAARKPASPGPQGYRFGVSPQLAPRSVTSAERKAYADYQDCTDASPKPAKMKTPGGRY